MNKEQLRQLIREELKATLSKNEELEEGLIKNISIAALFTLLGLSPVKAQQSRADSVFQDPHRIEKVDIMLNPRSEGQFNSFEDFHNYFSNNIMKFRGKDATIKDKEFKIVVDDTLYLVRLGDHVMFPQRSGLSPQKAIDKIPGTLDKYSNYYFSKETNMLIPYKLFQLDVDDIGTTAGSPSKLKMVP